MLKQQIKLGSLVTLSSIILIVVLIYLAMSFQILKELVFNFLGPLAIMVLFVGIFLLIAGLMKKEDTEKKQ